MRGLRRYHGSALRSVEKQSQIASSEFVDTAQEQHRLEELLEASKPSLAPDIAGLHWLLRSAFRYPPLPWGSRFGSVDERGILYLSETRPALEAELIFYAFKFFEDMAQPPPGPIQRAFTLIRVEVTAQRACDIGEDPERDKLIDPESWQASQHFGRHARERGAELIRYPAARVPAAERDSHCNLAVLEPAVVAGNAQPPAVGSCLTLTDASGVRCQGEARQTRYVTAQALRARPFDTSKPPAEAG